MFGEQPWIRVSAASTELGVVRSTAHRLLAMLQYHGFVEQDPETKAYCAGPALREIGLAAVRRMDIRGVLRPLLESLSEQFEETVQLVTLQDDDVQFLDSVESQRILRTSSRVGMTLPACCTAGGKVLLAELSPDRLRELYPNPRLERRTPQSLATRKELEAELEEIRKRGYAVNFGESEEDVAAVAAAVRGNGRPRVAIAVTAPLSRLSRSQASRMGKTLVAAVDRAAAELLSTSA